MARPAITTTAPTTSPFIELPFQTYRFAHVVACGGPNVNSCDDEGDTEMITGEP